MKITSLLSKASRVDFRHCCTDHPSIRSSVSNIKKLLTLIVILLGLGTRGVSQAPDPVTFDIDTLTTAASSALPFDSPFILKLRGPDATSIHSGIVYHWKERNGKKFFVEKKKLLFVNTGVLDELFDIDATKNVFSRKKGVDLYVGPLPPNKNIAIMLAHRFDGDLLKSVLDINYKIWKGPAGSADASISQLVKDAADKIQSTYNFDPKVLKDQVSFNFPTWKTGNVLDPVGGYKTFFANRLVKIYDVVFDPAGALERANAIAGLTLADISAVGPIAVAAKKESSELAILGSVVQRNLLTDVQKGKIPLTTDFFKAKSAPERIDERVANLKASKKSLELLSQFLENLMISCTGPQQAVVQPVLASVNALGADIDARINFAEPKLNDILEEVAQESNLTYTTWAFGNNQILDLKTKGTRYVMPVIGLAAIKAYGNTKDEFFVRPYIGASIYLRAINKDIPFSGLDHKFLHRFSINLGLTTSKISTGEFSDLIESLSLLAGANYKLSQGIQLSAGTVVMQRADVNPAIKDSKISYLNPYLSIAFDLDLVGAIKDITDKL